MIQSAGWARRLGVGKPRFAPRHQPAADLSHHGIAVNLDSCIQCTRCLRACREEQVNDVIGYAFRGEHSKIVFDFDDPMGQSTCVACGECVQACPTGALFEKSLMDPGAAHRALPKAGCEAALDRLDRLRHAKGPRRTAEIRLEMQKTMQKLIDDGTYDLAAHPDGWRLVSASTPQLDQLLFA